MSITRKPLARLADLKALPTLQLLGVPRDKLMQDRGYSGPTSSKNRVRRGGALRGSGGFWHRDFWERQTLLEMGRDAFREKIKRVHTDKGGNHEEAAQLTMAWSRLKRLAKKNGHEL